MTICLPPKHSWVHLIIIPSSTLNYLIEFILSKHVTFSSKHKKRKRIIYQVGIVFSIALISSQATLKQNK